MTQMPTNHAPRRGRIFPDHNWSVEEKARRKAEQEAFYQRCRAIFEQVRAELIDKHYDWFIVIEPDSGDYFIAADEEVAAEKARQKHPDAWFGTFRINQTGACGRI